MSSPHQHRRDDWVRDTWLRLVGRIVAIRGSKVYLIGACGHKCWVTQIKDIRPLHALEGLALPGIDRSDEKESG